MAAAFMSLSKYMYIIFIRISFTSFPVLQD